MRSGTVIFTTRYPGHLTVFIVLIVLALALLLYGCGYEADADGSDPDGTAFKVVCVVCCVLMGTMLIAYAVLPGVFRLFGDSYISWYAASGCTALAAFALEMLCIGGVFSGIGTFLPDLLCGLLRILMVLTAFGAAMHQCKPQLGLWPKRLSAVVVAVLSIGAAAAVVCCPGSTGVLMLTGCTGLVGALAVVILCRGVFGSGRAAQIPAIGTLAMLTGFFFTDVCAGVQSQPVHQLILPLCLLIMLVCWFLMISGKQKVQIAALEKALTAEQGTARTQAAFLASQIQPHFLYNTLMTIQELCYTDPRQAANTVVRFSNYLRQNIDFMEYKDKIPFSVELKHIENYIDIQRARFGNAIQFIKEIEFETFELPPLTVQPLIENAVSHGIRRHNGQGTVTLSARKLNGHVLISVNDDGVGFDVNSVHSRSLENIRCRIEGAMDGEIQIDSRPKKGTTVTIKFPWKEESHENRDR